MPIGLVDKLPVNGPSQEAKHQRADHIVEDYFDIFVTREQSVTQNN
jgi:hypothetical protein